MSPRADDLGTTRYAILGQLALRDWSAYELTQSMRRTVRFFWPRAESVVYAEAKRLEADGFASSRSEPARDGSRRTRAVYSITAAGRAALRAWLGSSPTAPQLYAETLLRVHLARFGTPADLGAAITAADAGAAEILEVADAVATEFVAGSHIFQAEAHIRGMLFDALVGYARFLQSWADESRAELARWPDIGGDEKANRRAVARMRAYLDTRG